MGIEELGERKALLLEIVLALPIAGRITRRLHGGQ
jgi:hypothetical protein